MLNLTHEDILRDIEGFKERIRKAESRLNTIPSGYVPYNEHRKREAIRSACQDEIRHVKKLIEYATEALQ